MAEIRALTERHEANKKEHEYLHALVCSVIANVHRQKGKTFKPKDFMRTQKKKQTIEEMAIILQGLAGG